MIAFLKPIADKLLDAVEKYILDRIGNILPKDAKEAIARMKRAITSAKLDLETEAEYDIDEAKVNTAGAAGGTSAFVAVKLDEDAGVFSARKRYAKPFVGYPVDKSNADKVVISISTKAASSAKALGKRGDASAMAANMTAFFSFVACKDERGGVDYQFFPLRLDASYDEDALKQLGRSAILDVYAKCVENFNDDYDVYSQEVEDILGDTFVWEKCVAAKARLDAIQEKASVQMVQYREQVVAAIEAEKKNNK